MICNHPYIWRRFSRKVMLRVAFTLLATVLIAKLVVPLSQAHSAEQAIAGKPGAWDQLVKAARREGTLVLFGPSSLGSRGPGMIENAFKKPTRALKCAKPLVGGTIL